MKFVMAFLAVVVLSALLGGGMILMATGHGVWLLVLSIVVFLGMFVRFGCRAH